MEGRKFFIYILPLFATLFLCLVISCRRCYESEVYAHIESCLETNPDSAWCLYDSIDYCKDVCPRDSFLYGLVGREIEVHRVYPSDTATIWYEHAIPYFDSRNDALHAGISLLLKGRALMMADDYEESYRVILQAERYFEKTDNLYWKAALLRQKSSVLCMLHDGPAAVRVAREALPLLERHGSERGVLKGLYSLGHAMYVNSQYQESSEILLDVYIRGKILNDSNIIYESLDILARSDFFNRRYAEVVAYYQEMSGLRYVAPTASDYEILGNSYFMLGEIDKAWECLDSIKSLGESGYGLEWILLRESGQYERALRSLASLCDILNTDSQQDWSSNASNILTGHYEAERDMQARLLTTQKRLNISLWVMCILIVCVFMGIGFYLRRKYREGRMQMEARQEEMKRILDSSMEALAIAKEKGCHYRDLCAEYEKQNEDLSSGKSALAEEAMALMKERHQLDEELSRMRGVMDNDRLQKIELLAASYKVLKDCFDDYRCCGEVEKLKSAWYRRLSKKIAGEKSVATMLMEMERNIDHYCGGLMKDLRKSLPEMSDLDIHIFLLTVYQFSADLISMMLGVDKKKVYNRRTRIKEQIRKSGVEDKERFLKLM